MICNNCKSENIAITEEQGNYNMKQKHVMKIPIIILTAIILIMIFIKDFSFIIPNFQVIMIALIIIDVILIAISSESASSNYHNSKKKWVKTSRTKFTCMNCGAQWYANTENDEFLK